MSEKPMPEAEYKSRIAKVQQLVSEQGLDAAFVYYDELNIANGWYLSAWCPQFESGAVLVPAKGDPMILGGPESEPFAKLDSMIPETRNVPVFMVPDEEYPGARISSFKEIFGEISTSGGVKRLGLVGVNKMPVSIYWQMESELSGIELVDITDEFESFRKVKSEWEIEQIRHAFTIADEGFKTLSENVKPGVAEHYPAGLAEGKMRSLGANGFGFKTILGSGARSNGVVPTSSGKLLEKGELLLCGVSARYNGYSSAACLPIVVGGSPSKQQKQYISDVVEAFRITREQLIVGKKGSEVDAVPRAFLKEKGYGPYMLVPYGHTIGLLEAEAPFFGPNSDDVLEAGMTVCIDISLFGHPELYGIRAETGYVITKHGAEALSPYMEQQIMNSG